MVVWNGMSRPFALSRGSTCAHGAASGALRPPN